jgi:hypothetical protein
MMDLLEILPKIRFFVALLENSLTERYKKQHLS